MGLREWYQTQTAKESSLREQIASVSAPVTTEDWFWGRIGTTGSEEDYFWRRLSDNWTQKDVLPSTYQEIHNQVYEAYNANPLANAIVEMGVNALGGGVARGVRSGVRGADAPTQSASGGQIEGKTYKCREQLCRSHKNEGAFCPLVRCLLLGCCGRLAGALCVATSGRLPGR